jgi:hypothetical protein
VHLQVCCSALILPFLFPWPATETATPSHRQSWRPGVFANKMFVADR